MINLCAPVIIYIVFSIPQIFINTLQGLNNDALLQTFVVILVSMLLQVLCERELTFVAWLFVFIPLIFMSILSAMLLFFTTKNSTINESSNNCTNEVKREIVVNYLPEIPYGSSSPEYQS
jgi:hypothetical protein